MSCVEFKPATVDRLRKLAKDKLTRVREMRELRGYDDRFSLFESSIYRDNMEYDYGFYKRLVFLQRGEKLWHSIASCPAWIQARGSTFSRFSTKLGIAILSTIFTTWTRNGLKVILFLSCFERESSINVLTVFWSIYSTVQ